MSILQWPNALRAKGLSVYTRPGWENIRPIGNLRDPLAGLFWHHDATNVGNSPGGWDWIVSAYDNGRPSAQIWIDYVGQWRFVGAGKAHHAGIVRGPLDSTNCVGAEWDHTVNEPVPFQLMHSIQLGFAAICEVEKRDASFITMHKIEAVTADGRRGRKVDPWLSDLSNDIDNWDRELADQRRIIQQLINGQLPLPLPLGDDEMRLVKTDDDHPVYLIGAGSWRHISPTDLSVLVARKYVDAGKVEVLTRAQAGQLSVALTGKNNVKPKSTPGPSFHTVVKGDTLFKLAQKYKTTVPVLVRLNNFANQNVVINIGQKIRVK